MSITEAPTHFFIIDKFLFHSLFRSHSAFIRKKSVLLKRLNDSYRLLFSLMCLFLSTCRNVYERMVLVLISQEAKKF